MSAGRKERSWSSGVETERDRLGWRFRDEASGFGRASCDWAAAKSVDFLPVGVFMWSSSSVNSISTAVRHQLSRPLAASSKTAIDINGRSRLNLPNDGEASGVLLVLISSMGGKYPLSDCGLDKVGVVMFKKSSRVEYSSLESVTDLECPFRLLLGDDPDFPGLFPWVLGG